jgi:hypothetical protein
VPDIALGRRCGPTVAMPDRYFPPSEFLQAVIADDVCFGGHVFGEANLQRLIAATRHTDAANRDWAVMLLSQLKLDRPDVRAALSEAAEDDAFEVRAEAIHGLALIDPRAALPFLSKALRGETVSMPLLEAADLVADPMLICDLEAFAEGSDDAFLDTLVANAIAACRASIVK